MNLEDFLSRLNKVRKTGPNNWIACCPAHDDKSPSMTVARGRNDGIVVHCFALCQTQDIVFSLGLELSDLMPEKPSDDFVPGKSRPYSAGDILECIAEEVQIAWVISRDMELAKPIKQDDFDRLTLANKRIQEALGVARGR